MSILDGMPFPPTDLMAALEHAGPVIEQMKNELSLSPKMRSVVDLLQKGLSLADIFGVTERERDALFLKGCHLIKIGQFAMARDTLVMLYQLEPLDARVIYALASTFQMEGDVSRAAKLYIQFLALDATNTEGYLRLGECFLAAGEYADAHGCFQVVKEGLVLGKCSDAAVAHATRMIAVVEKRRTAC